MQLRSDFTKDELLEDCDPLANACHPLDKIQSISDLFVVGDETGIRSFTQNGANGLSGILEDSVKEIELLIDVSNKQYLKLRDEKKQLEFEIVELKDLAFKNQLRGMIKTSENKER